jgi:predicted RNase H-like HicB family nuclease
MQAFKVYFRNGGNNVKNTYTAIIELEDDIYVALCPELDIASQGKTIVEAKENLAEAVELFLETADASEILQRTHSEAYVTSFEVSVG